MPSSSDALNKSAALGQRLATLLDTREPAAGVTDGAIEPLLRIIGGVSAPNLSLEGWGSKTADGKVQPGKDQTRPRSYTTEEQAALSLGWKNTDLSPERIVQLLGPPLDIPLNSDAVWSCVPKAVWEFTIGGYQPIKKYLSYRDRSVLKRPLTPAEAREVTGMVRRLTVMVLMHDQLNANYVACAGTASPWPLDALAPLVRAT